MAAANVNKGLVAQRQERRQAGAPAGSNDYRTPGQRDRDRILYSLAIRRLGSVTQVAAAGEIQLFHTRLTHSLKVAQLGRRMAEKILKELPADVGERPARRIISTLGGLDPDVVEAAGLAHDLGHPPFGHIAERKLSGLLGSGPLGRFEGNAQSFRIITKLSTGYADRTGLDLTRAVLRAVLKYPTIQGASGVVEDPNARRRPTDIKWGVYSTEGVDHAFAMQIGKPGEVTLEAQIMDWADDISYAVHDLEDFVRAGLIPVDRLKTSDVEWRRFLGTIRARLDDRGFTPIITEEAGRYIRSRLPFEAPYTHSLVDRNALHELASELISRYVDQANLKGKRWALDHTRRCEVELLKQMTWHYVINSSALASLQRGQERVISDLFGELTNWCMEPADERRRLPSQLDYYRRFALRDREGWRLLRRKKGKDAEQPLVQRAVADYISHLTEVQALQLHRRLTGRSEGSAMEGWLRV